MSQCYYCDKNIIDNLDFCSECYKPLVSCPKCGRYFSPLTNYCNQCKGLTFLGELEIPTHHSSTSNTLSNINHPYTFKKKVLSDKMFNDEFNIEPLIAIGYLFVVSQKGRIYTLNLHTLEEYTIRLNKLPVTEIRTNIILIRSIIERGEGRKTRKYHLCVASNEEMLILPIEQGSDQNSIAFRDPIKWSLDGYSKTNPLYLSDRIIIGTDQGLLAYKLDGTKLWKYDANKALPDEIINTSLTANGSKVFFGSNKEDRFFIHCVNAHSGFSCWDQPYQINSNRITDIYKTSDSERLILYDYDGILYNLDIKGKYHYPPISSLKGNNQHVQTCALSLKENNIFVATPSGSIHCMDLFGSMVKTEYTPSHSVTFHSRTIIGFDFMAFTSPDGTILFVHTGHKNSDRVEAQVMEIPSILGEVKTPPVMSYKHIYVLSNRGQIIRIGN